MEERVVLTGSMIIDGSVDVTKAFTIVYDRGPEVELISVEYLTQSAQLVELEIEGSESIPVAEEEIATAIEVEEISVGSDILEVESSIATEFVQEDDTTGANSSIEIADRNPVTVVQTENLLLEFNELQEETFLERILLETSWGRVGKLTGLFSLVLIAFFVKKSWVRIFTLGLTLLYLGFADGGFLSVSHITSGIWVGPSFYLSDLPLLMLVVFTLITTFLWGRVFCGFLCPFGVLQDLLERVVPKRLRPSIPTKIHKSGLKLKYVFLAIILVSAVSGSKVSLYQYFEPFGTVFFRSSSVTLWAIALFFLGISLVVPRFYCRYACPLGAALALTSLLSLKRIKRVEQCKSCHVCEQSCPTGAIEGPEIDFKECVRCNICEIKLIEKSGVCRHDIEDVRGRLVPLSGKAT
jgi:ferredoxin